MCGRCCLALRIRAATGIVIKFSPVVAENTPKEGALRFQEPPKRPQRRVKVEVYPTASCTRTRRKSTPCSLGRVQMLAPSCPIRSAGCGANSKLFDLAFIFGDRERALAGVTGRDRRKEICWPSSIARASTASRSGTKVQRT